MRPIVVHSAEAVRRRPVLRARQLVYVACGASLALASGARAQTTARDTLPVVRRLQIEGNAAFSDGEIKRRLETRASGCKSFLLSPFCWLGIGAFRRTERLDVRELRTDVARVRIFYYRRGYRRARVDTTVVRERGYADVTFRIDEGAPVVVRELRVTGLGGAIDSAAIVSGLPLKVGDAFSELDLSAAKSQIERKLGNEGYAQAVVLIEASIPSSDTLGAYVTLQVQPGPLTRIGTIVVNGTSALDPEDVKRLLTFRAGDIYRAEEIIRSQRTLYSMALFEYVDIATKPSESDSTIDVRVQVNEADMRGVQLGFGLTTAECLQLEARWTHRNFLRGTRRLELSGELSNIATSGLARRFPCSQAGVDLSKDKSIRGPFNKVNWRVRADFQQPWFLGTANWLRVGAFSERQSLPEIYARTSFGGDVRFSREIAAGTPLTATYRAERDRLDKGSADFLFCANFGVCQPGDIAELSESRWLSWVGFTFGRSRTDIVLNPTTGYRLSLEGETGSRFTGSGWSYYRTQAEFSWYQRVSAGAILAVRLRGGMVRPIGSGIVGAELTGRRDPVTHPLKRLYAGGANTVRGYGQNLLGPKVLLADSADLPGCAPPVVTANNTWVCDPNEQGLTSGQLTPRPVGGQNAVVGNVELRFPLAGGRWGAVAFLDLGQVWTTSGDVRTRRTVAWSPGIGLRYLSPVGPLRLDIGYNTGGTERLPVVSELKVASELSEGGEPIIVQLGDASGKPILFKYDPFEESGFRGFLNRLQLHFSIGQAF